MKKKDFTISRRDPQKEEQLAKEFRKKMRNLLNFIKSSPDWAFRYDLFKAAESETLDDELCKKLIDAFFIRAQDEGLPYDWATIKNLLDDYYAATWFYNAAIFERGSGCYL